MEERLAAQSVLELIKKKNKDKEWLMKNVFRMSGINEAKKQKIVVDIYETKWYINIRCDERSGM